MKDIEKKGIPKILKFLIFIVILIILIILYSKYIGTIGLKVKEYKITANITDNFHGLKIVQISDVHFDKNINNNFLKKIVKKINQIKPDILVFTGDLVDENTKLDDNYKKQIIDTLKKIEANYKLAIKGEEDFNDHFETIMTSSNFEVLNNSYKLIYNKDYDPILISGITSNLKDNSDIYEKLEETYKYINNNKTIYNILLLHEPDYIENIDTSKFNLILAGHSHNGQIIIPKIGGLIKQKGSKKYYKDYYNIDNTDMYISGGIGTSNIRFRLFNHPSINLYRLTNH